MGAGEGAATVLSSAADDSGVKALSMGSMVEAEAGVTAKSEGYSSPGVDKKDSVGDISNLTSGVGTES